MRTERVVADDSTVIPKPSRRSGVTDVPRAAPSLEWMATGYAGRVGRGASADPPDAVRVLVLTDCTVSIAGFEALLTSDPGIVIVGFAGDAAVLGMIEGTQPHLVVIPMHDGAVETCAAIEERYPALPVLLVATSLDDEDVRSAIDAGARGYVYKDIAPAGLRSAVKRLAAGESILDPRVAGRIIEWAAGHHESGPFVDLSERELDVLRLASRGEPNKRIAKELGVSVNTVKTYLHRAYQKLGCHTRAEATSALARSGLL